MVNASLNWASIVGIVLAVGGALLYFMRNFKPALARDYDVFFAAVGLLCGGILFFQGWRLDPILQFGQFLLAGTTVFFAYESVRLRGVTTEQARRSSFFDDDEPPLRPRMGGGRDVGPDRDRFEEPEPLRRRFSGRPEDDDERDDFYRPRRTPRPAIPERAASRRPGEDWQRQGWGGAEAGEREPDSSRRYRAGEAGGAGRSGAEFGSRRREREERGEVRRGSRPTPNADTLPRSSRRPGAAPTGGSGSGSGIPQGSPIRGSRSGDPSSTSAQVSDAEFSPLNPQAGGSDRSGGGGSPSQAGRSSGPASRPPRPDNSSRFDD